MNIKTQETVLVEIFWDDSDTVLKQDFYKWQCDNEVIPVMQSHTSYERFKHLYLPEDAKKVKAFLENYK